MTKAIFINIPILYPVAELHKIQKTEENDLSHAYFCNGALRYCQANPFGRKPICWLCTSRAKDAANFLGLELIPINLNDDTFPDNLTSSILENHVMSSLASILRITSRSDLEGRWLSAYKNIIKSSRYIYNFFNNDLKRRNITELRMFNGRFAFDGAAKVAAKNNNCDYVLYDFKKSVAYYSFRNESLHSAYANTKKALSFYLESPQIARETADKFINAKKKGIPTFEKSYTDQQTFGKFIYLKSENKKILSIFPSSDDEYRYLGDDWGVKLVASQPDELFKFCANINITNLKIIVRLHPNMSGLSSRARNPYKLLESNFANVSVIDPEDDSSTYELIEMSDFVLCFCSTVAPEANFLRKPVICIGGAPYSLLKVAHYVNDGLEAAEKINSRVVSLKPKRASIIWFNYMWRYGEPNIYMDWSRYVKVGELQNPFSFPLYFPHYLRFLQAPFRFEINIFKPFKLNLYTLTGIIRSAYDVIFNRFSNK